MIRRGIYVWFGIRWIFIGLFCYVVLFWWIYRVLVVSDIFIKCFIKLFMFIVFID